MRSPFCYFCSFCVTLLSHADSFYCPAEIKEIAEIIVTDPREVLSVLSALSAWHYYLLRIVFFCPAEIKEIKEIFIPLCAALSAISALSAGHYYLMRIIFYCPDFYCPAEIKEIAEIIVTDPREVLSALSAGLLVSHAHSIFMVPQSSALPLRSSKK